MVGRVRSTGPELLQRRCVACGFDGPSLDRAGLLECPGCGCDFEARPPRSYAEMEGIVTTVPARIRPQASESPSLLHRWLAFLFLMFAGVAAAILLLASTIP